MTVQVIHEGAVPIYSWADWESLEIPAKNQIRNATMLPIIAGCIMVMPDAHMGKGACVGSVIPTKNAIIPASVGVDIGCGMAAVKLSLSAKNLPDSLKVAREQIERDVPVGAGMHALSSLPSASRSAASELEEGLTEIIKEAPTLLNRRKTKNAWALQIGTLGGGNHFIELCLDESDNVWLMLHSGSRGIGNVIGEYYIAKAREMIERERYGLPDKDLSWLSEGSSEFNEYWKALAWAQNYAKKNREVMMDLTLRSLSRCLPEFTISSAVVNCHHNYVAKEQHDGCEIYVTRKGAISAKRGEMGIIPGSMGTASYIVEGLGNEASFCSCSHGAGRRMSRGEAKRVFSVDDLIEQTNGIECRKDKGVIDEIPGSYKNIDEVMDRQKDLVRPIHQLRQVLCVKG